MKKKMVVLADRYPAMLEGIKGLLAAVFESVIMVSDEESLMTTLIKLNPDLVVVDLSLQVTRESNVIALLHNYNPKLKIIALSTHEEPEWAEHCMSSGAMGCILKRLAGTDLLKAVDEVLKGGTFVSSLPHSTDEKTASDVG